ncbi:U32 family peptidase [Campylobacter sp. FMV-PI01]|uniref:U32 family peptidase n=1 Tax=Campylobacter portucalensis TaxID=2608384 RepID=A0A6L5WGI1_9BACT|nr:peptidase U32 family protein [Campylobacter portucalensis]MSN96089.1 U32 family peptidase [Campylobacter portucalensis]
MNKPELLSPAGNLTKLKIALNYGADAVYASMGSFSLRQRSAKEFNPQSFEEGVSLTHKFGKKFYATINGFPSNAQLENLKKHIEFLGSIGVDAFIIASPSVINLAKNIAPDIEIHLSTQANVMNYLDAKVFYDMGVKRVVVAREIGLKDVIKIKEELPNLEIEIFIHGSMCFAYSGRCLISALQSGRFSNRGSCANDCRFNYEIYAKNDESGALFRLNEDENGTYIMNSKDLNLASHIEKIIKSGAVDSFKIEGRTKSEYYVACATNAYRMAIDDTINNKFNPEIYQKELHTLKNRGFTDGYLVSRPFEKKDTQNFDSTLEEGTHQVCAISEDGVSFKTKFKIILNESYEIFTPMDGVINEINNEIGKIYKKDGKFFVKFKTLKAKNNKEFSEIHSGNINEILLPTKLPKFSFLRKEI